MANQSATGQQRFFQRSHTVMPFVLPSMKPDACPQRRRYRNYSDSSATHFYTTFGGENLQAGQTLRILGDGQPIFDAQMLSQEEVPGSGHEVMADLPGSILVNTLGPALMRSNTMQVDFGGQRFTARLTDLRPVAAQIKDCALTMRRLYS